MAQILRFFAICGKIKDRIRLALQPFIVKSNTNRAYYPDRKSATPHKRCAMSPSNGRIIMTLQELFPISLGALIILVPNLRFLYVKLCYVKVHAICISMNYHRARDSEGDTYQPIWQYEYEGMTYVSHELWWSRANFRIGDEAEIYISPKKPRKMYSGSAGSVLGFTIIVLIMMLIAWFFISR